MFGELGPRLKGGFNDLLSFFIGTTTTFKPTPNQDFLVSGGDAVPNVNVFGEGANGRAITLQGSPAIGVGSTGGAATLQGGSAPITGQTTGGNVSIQAGGGYNPGNVSITGGTANATQGGNVTLTGGTGTSTNYSGNISLYTQQGGLITIQAKDSISTPEASGGNIIIKAASTIGAAAPGNVSITAGNNSAALAYNVNGGSISLTTGSGGATNANGGAVNLTTGAGAGTGNGGDIKLTTGTGGASGGRGNIVLNSGNGAALAVGSTGGFVQLPTVAGQPTGTPASITAGCVPMVFDTTNVKLWAYTGGSWQGAIPSSVTSVSGQTGAVVVSATDVSTASGTTLIGNSGATTGTITIKRIVAGSGISVANDGNGNLQITSTASAPVTSVSGQTGVVIVQATDNNTASGTSLIANNGSTTANIKLLRLVAGTNTTLTTDSNSNLVINSTYTAPAQFYDVQAGSSGTLTAGQVLGMTPAVRTIAFPANFGSSVGYASVTATASTVITVSVWTGGTTTQIGTITFAAGAPTATFATTGGTTQTVSPGSVIIFTAPGTADATLGNVAITLIATAS